MFTGIVEELGTVAAVVPVTTRAGDGVRLTIEAREVLADATTGASIAVSGCCLTVVDGGDGWWAADVQPESLRRTTLGALRAGDAVNLERPVRLADRLGGHLVQGHVDGVGEVVGRAGEPGGSLRLTVRLPPSVVRYVVEKGSIAIDGVSLTVAAARGDHVEVGLVPHTLAVTTLGRTAVGSRVNVEADVLAKYVERLLEPSGALGAKGPR